MIRFRFPCRNKNITVSTEKEKTVDRLDFANIKLNNQRALLKYAGMSPTYHQSIHRQVLWWLQVL
jgi:hypothetical protein